MANGGLVAWLRIRFNVNEILAGLMFTGITRNLLLYLVIGHGAIRKAWVSLLEKPFIDLRFAGLSWNHAAGGDCRVCALEQAGACVGLDVPALLRRHRRAAPALAD